MPDFECYSIRRLSPFQGVLQVVKTPEARALSVDGHSWHIQIRCELRRPRWGGNPKNVKIHRRYVAFALWSPQDGLTRLPIDPTLERPRLEVLSEQLMVGLKETVEQVPLTRRDSVELWLLNGEDRLPLVLLGSALEGRPLPTFRRLEWLPCGAGDRSFVAPSLRQRAPHTSVTHIPSHKSSHRGAVANLVHRAAGLPRRAQWFVRQQDGAGIGLGSQAQSTEEEPWCGMRLPKTAFPEPLLRDQWAETAEQDLVADFLSWQAPYLLTLSELAEATRGRLEHAARQRPMVVQALHRLYPAVINREVITAARVEASLRRAAGE